MTQHPEDAIQSEVAAFLDALKLPWFHPANERQCSPQAGAMLKRKGVKAGVPDIVICRSHAIPKSISTTEGITFHWQKKDGLAIELKAPGNYPTQEQKLWLARLEKEGWSTAVCRSLDQVVDVLSTCDLLRHPETGNLLDIDNARHGFITEAR